MKSMSLEEVKTIRDKGNYKMCGGASLAGHANRLICEFMISGIEAAEILPVDYGRTPETMTKSTSHTMRDALVKRIEEMALTTTLEAFRRKDRIFLMRIDL